MLQGKTKLLLFVAGAILFCSGMKVGCGVSPGPMATRGPGSFLTGRGFLYCDQQEDADYGLQSYIVVAAKPADRLEQARIKALYKSYRSTFEDSSTLASRGSDKKSINCTYWPLSLTAKEAEDSADQGNKCTFASLLLKAPDSQAPSDRAQECSVALYGYARAQRWLHKMEITRGKGPYIVSSFVPLGKLAPKTGAPPMLILDLTKIDRDQFADVMVFFRSKVCERPDTWKDYKWDLEWIKITGRSALHQHADSAIKLWAWVSGKVDVSSVYAGTSP